MSRVADLAEKAMGGAAGGGEIFDLKLSYVSAVDGTVELRVTPRVVHAGKRTIVTECRVETTDGRLVATASATFAVIPDKER